MSNETPRTMSAEQERICRMGTLSMAEQVMHRELDAERAAKWRAVAEELAEAAKPLIDTAESHAMQTYDRGGVTGEKIAMANTAIARFDALVKEEGHE